MLNPENETAVEALIQQAGAPVSLSRAEAFFDATIFAGFTEHDYAELALILVDQAGASLSHQDKIKKLLDAALDRCQCESCMPSRGDR